MVPAAGDDAATAAPAPPAPSRWVLHVDLDQFVAAVEVRRRPELAGRPVVVGGDGDPRRPRQVVATATYEARALGVRSGVPMSRALRLCPEAVFLPHDAPAYDAASAEVMAALGTLPVAVEVLGWDEAFLGTDTDDPRGLAEQVRRTVREATTLSCAVGIGDNRLRAKTATGFAKPGGIATLTERDWAAVMGPRPVRELWGVGPRTASRLAELGVSTVEELAAADHEVLARRFGPATGPWLVLTGRGRSSAVVDPAPWVPRSASRETTFASDLTTPLEVRAALGRLADDVAADVAADGRAVVRVAVKVRVRPFLTRTRSVAVRPATTDPTALLAAALEALSRLDTGSDAGTDAEGGLLRPVRLLGVRADFADAS
ncbi:DNA polymerase IV [Aquipuribacter sp. SD81]|uniref:DNA polymerase IV n=1 Tax=Aquipuribacter sp. SD81 TaxID=3127703 RepID=UPI003016AFFF